MSFAYKHVLLVGATAGIGRGMAERFVESGVTVTAVGRRKERLDELVSKYGPTKVNAEPFDISDLDNIKGFAAEIMSKYPDLDCLFLNAGIQARYDLADPEQFNLDVFNNEMKVNCTSFVALVHAFLPYFQKRETAASIIFTGSNLAIVPASVLPGYSASKAALNVFTLCLREQLKSSNINVIEVSPPPVQTELHDYMGKEIGRSSGMPLAAFTEKAYQGLVEGKDQIIIGSIGPADTFNEIVDKRRAAFENLAKMMRQH